MTVLMTLFDIENIFGAYQMMREGIIHYDKLMFKGDSSDEESEDSDEENEGGTQIIYEAEEHEEQDEQIESNNGPGEEKNEQDSMRKSYDRF